MEPTARKEGLLYEGLIRPENIPKGLEEERDRKLSALTWDSPVALNSHSVEMGLVHDMLFQHHHQSGLSMTQSDCSGCS